MTYKLDAKSGMSYIPSILVFLGAVVAAINYFTSAVELPAVYSQALITIVAILLAVTVFFTNIKDMPIPE